MTINYIYNITKEVMYKLEHIDYYDIKKNKYNQQNLNEAYNILDNLKDELIRESIKNRQKHKQKEGD